MGHFYPFFTPFLPILNPFFDPLLAQKDPFLALYLEIEGSQKGVTFGPKNDQKWSFWTPF